MNKTLKYCLLALVVMVATSAQAQTFSCTGNPITVRDSASIVSEFSTASNTFGAGTVVNPGVVVNGIGYNVNDDFIYGIVSDTNGVGGYVQKDMVRIKADGTLDNLGTPSPINVGNPWTNNQFNGTMDDNNIWYNIDGTNIYTVDVTSNPLMFNDMALTGDAFGTIADLTFNPLDNLLYAIGNDGGVNYLYQITTAGVVTRFDDANAQLDTTMTSLPATAGGAWSQSDGTLFFYHNNDMANPKLYTVDTSSSPWVVTEFSNGLFADRFDATACFIAPVVSSSPALIPVSNSFSLLLLMMLLTVFGINRFKKINS